MLSGQKPQGTSHKPQGKGHKPQGKNNKRKKSEDAKNHNATASVADVRRLSKQ
jgi:hypothetical protein